MEPITVVLPVPCEAFKGVILELYPDGSKIACLRTPAGNYVWVPINYPLIEGE